MGNKKKVLLMGKSGAGKTSMRSIIFANYVARDTRRLGPTMNVEHSYIRFLGTMVLNLWDCGGQPNYFEHYITPQRDQIFKGAEVLIFVISIETKELQDDLRLYQSCLEALTNLSPEAKVVCLVSKMDLVADEKREQEFAAREAEIKKRSIPFKVTCYPTSIWDESLYKAWSSIIYSLVPNIAKFEASLNKFADIMRADEVLLFEKSTYLIIAHAVRKKHPDSHRFEKISNIIKQFKLNASRFVANLHTMRMEIINGDLKIFLDILTPNTAIMVVVTDPLVYPAAISLNIQSARKHFEMLEKLDRAPILQFGEPKQALK